MLQINNFKKDYSGHLILDIPELHIPTGVSWFQGVNGSGKSTFFKAISGIIPFKGNVSYNDALDLKKDAVQFRKIINYSFAEPRYPEYLTGKNIIDYYQKIYKTPFEEIDKLVALFETDTYYKTAISTYSSGMLKKISLISTFIGNPKILALDEPLTTIDKGSQSKLLELLAARVAQGTHVLIASHHELPESDLAVNHHFRVEDKTIIKSRNDIN
jgi:ABC-2 type transport system ATP-binding protein